jgi:hypothetical protein
VAKFSVFTSLIFVPFVDNLAVLLVGESSGKILSFSNTSGVFNRVFTVYGQYNRKNKAKSFKRNILKVFYGIDLHRHRYLKKNDTRKFGVFLLILVLTIWGQ